MTTITASATFGSWVEEPDFGSEAPLPRIAHATVAFSYRGDLHAEGACQYVLAYGADGTGTGVGFEQVTGRIGEEDGEVVLRHDATFDASGVTCRYDVVAGSGTGAFADATGSGSYQAGLGAETGWEWVLDLSHP